MISEGFGPPDFAASVATRPLSSAKRRRSACVAGAVALPGSAMPSASEMQAIVLAVPITMQVPEVGARRPLISSIWSSVNSPARWRAQKRRQSVQAPL